MQSYVVNQFRTPHSAIRIPHSVVCLMGPTASGKTALALRLADYFPIEIISVDSAMVYRGLDIGTAKPAPAILKAVPHHLIDICAPKDIYSAGQFCVDAEKIIADVVARGNIPLLVGGTMLYFKALQAGLAVLPKQDTALRARLLAEAQQQGMDTLHQQLCEVDPESAKRLSPRDIQRILRALEVYHQTGKPWSAQLGSVPSTQWQWINIALVPNDRAMLHQHIEERFHDMMNHGFLEEVKKLQEASLSPDLPALKAVGYRQLWAYCMGQTSLVEAVQKGIAATRQLAKRQMTWLKSWKLDELLPADWEKNSTEILKTYLS